MKTWYFATWMLLIAPFLSVAQTTVHYTINLGIFVEPKRQDFQTIQSVGFLYSAKMENNHAQIFLGGFDSRALADNALARVHSTGYTGAYVQERFLKDGEMVTIIQLAAADTRKPINWQKYANTPELWGFVSGDMLKLASGPYKTQEEARRALSALQGQGFKDAFIRTINSIYLVKIGSFETDNELKQPLIAFKWNTETPAENPKPAAKTDVPTGYDYTTTPKRPEPTVAPTPAPTRKEPQAVPPTEYAENLTTKSPASSTPIRGNVKRRAALELQKALKAENLYAGSLDGFYGVGTAQGYLNATVQNGPLLKYKLYVQHTPAGTPASSDALQNAINRLPEGVRFTQTLESYNHPLAKAYQAYQIFLTLGAGSEVNSLMNDAIRQAYASKPTRFTSPFDYKATYAYNDLDQLILHLYYIHVGPGMTYTAPCWLSKQHPQETARAQAALSGLSIPTQQVQPCDPFSDWEEIRMLDAIAQDLGSQVVAEVKLAEAAAAKASLYLASRPLSAATQKDLETWHHTLLTNLNNWGGRDPLHQRFVTPFKILFYQSAIRLEDFYMDKGFGTDEAKALALATLRTIIGPSMERFQ